MPKRQTICSDDHSDPTLAEAASSYLLDVITATHAAELFNALADPTRLRTAGL